MAKSKFNKEALSRAAASAKRTYKRQAKNGLYLDKKLNKTDALNKIASSLNVTPRSLYSGERKVYLDEWYNGLLVEIEEENEKVFEESEHFSKKELKDKKVEELLEELEQMKHRINAYKRRINEQELLIEELLKKEIKRYDKIDRVN